MIVYFGFFSVSLPYKCLLVQNAILGKKCAVTLFLNNIFVPLMENISGALKARAAGFEARTLPVCYVATQPFIAVCRMIWHHL